MVRPEHVKLDLKDLRFLYHLDKGSESSIIMVRYLDRNMIGKLYRRSDLDKNNLVQIVRQEMEVS